MGKIARKQKRANEGANEQKRMSRTSSLTLSYIKKSEASANGALAKAVTRDTWRASKCQLEAEGTRVWSHAWTSLRILAARTDQLTFDPRRRRWFTIAVPPSLCASHLSIRLSTKYKFASDLSTILDERDVAPLDLERSCFYAFSLERSLKDSLLKRSDFYATIPLIRRDTFIPWAFLQYRSFIALKLSYNIPFLLLIVTISASSHFVC